MGGISVSQTSSANSNDAQAWRYTMSVGALDYSASQAQGDLEYGPTAGNTVLSYQLDPQLTLESQLEMAPELLTTGIGGQYKTKDWGAWSAGVARASYGLREGWRYQTAYTVDVMDDLKLSWVNESRSAGFADLSRYQDASAAAAGVTQRLTATVPMGRWGDLAGTYENSRSSVGDTQHNFGVTQQFWYSPNLRIGLQAQRELMTGDYDVGIRFSVPIN
jgi:outer membrane usher protein FimD/PapC